MSVRLNRVEFTLLVTKMGKEEMSNLYLVGPLPRRET